MWRVPSSVALRAKSANGELPRPVDPVVGSAIDATRAMLQTLRQARIYAPAEFYRREIAALDAQIAADHPTAYGGVDSNFWAISNAFLSSPPHVRRVACSAFGSCVQACRALIGATNPMACPICFVRPVSGASAADSPAMWRSKYAGFLKTRPELNRSNAVHAPADPDAFLEFYWTHGSATRGRYPAWHSRETNYTYCSAKLRRTMCDMPGEQPVCRKAPCLSPSLSRRPRTPPHSCPFPHLLSLRCPFPLRCPCAVPSLPHHFFRTCHPSRVQALSSVPHTGPASVPYADRS